MWGDGVMGHGIREALFAAEIGKLTNSLGGGMDKKGGEIGTTWTTILNNFLEWKIWNFAHFLEQYLDKYTISTVFNANIEVLLTMGASHVKKSRHGQT